MVGSNPNRNSKRGGACLERKKLPVSPHIVCLTCSQVKQSY